MRSSAPERSARAVAFRVLSRVDVDRAFAAVALDTEIARASLDPRDARLATAIVYGTLREVEAIDRAIAVHLARSAKLDSAARAALRASVHQLARLDRQPAHAVVDEAVRWVRGERGPRVGGFVNAVLRKIAASPPALDDVARLSDDLVARLVASVGKERADAFLDERAVPSIDLRLRYGVDRAEFVAELSAAFPDATITPCRFSPLGVATRRIGDPRTLPGFADGRFVVQEQGSQLVALLLGARAGERVLDVCAGRGGKTTLLGEIVGEDGRVVASDLHEHRLDQIAAVFAKLGLRAPLETVAVDWTIGDGGVGAAFDRVLVDAPCSGLGTFHRRPELARRLSSTDVATLVETQRAILRTASRCVKPGGTLVYAVCSPLDDESRAVVDAAIDAGLTSHGYRSEEAFGLPIEADGSIALGPFLGGTDEGTDGYCIFRFQCVDKGGSAS